MTTTPAPAAPATHMLISWYLGRRQDSQIKRDLADRFRIRQVATVQWPPESFSPNLRRFYGMNLPKDSLKEWRECGHGPFTVYIFTDDQPEWVTRDTNSGPMLVNDRVFSLKQGYRARRSEGFSVHTTNNPQETARDLALLLGRSVAAIPKNWDGVVEDLDQQVTGVPEWKSFSQFWRTMGQVAPYVVLRNWHELEQETKTHADIDLLVEDRTSFALAAGAKAKLRSRRRAQYLIKIDGNEHQFDLRTVGDGYFAANWQTAVLQSRVSQDNFFTPDPVNHFFTLLYHALIHKPSMSAEYAGRLTELAATVDLPSSGYSPTGQLKLDSQLLADFLRAHSYVYSVPTDPSVVFNRRPIPPGAPVRRAPQRNIKTTIASRYFEAWQRLIGTAMRIKVGLSRD